VTLETGQITAEIQSTVMTYIELHIQNANSTSNNSAQRSNNGDEMMTERLDLDAQCEMSVMIVRECDWSPSPSAVVTLTDAAAAAAAAAATRPLGSTDAWLCLLAPAPVTTISKLCSPATLRLACCDVTCD